MRLDLPPDSLQVTFDMHGVRCEVRPLRPRPLWVQAMYAITAGAAVIAGLLVLAAVWTLALWHGVEWFLGILPVALWFSVIGWFFAYDRSQQLERLEVRVGEGWLVIRHRVANLLQEQAGKAPSTEIEMFVTETERIDLRACVDCRVVRGPILLVQRVAGPPFEIPMRSHTLDEIGWLACAINQGIRDAQRGTEPVPVALLNLRDPERATPES